MLFIEKLIKKKSEMQRLIKKAKGWFTSICTNTLIYWMLLAIIVGICFIQAVFYAYQQPSQLDEGAFMVKGYYYVTGQYAPFQDYGFWTNKMPLSFYVPGLAQVIFGPGLKTGRYFAIALLFLTIAPLWAVLSRLKGKWWALLGVLAMALNPTLIMTYVKANSQVVVACFLAWSLFFLLGENRKPWQIAVGAGFSTLAVLTRQNVIFVLPFVVLYAFWLQGKRAGWAAVAGAGIPMLAAHVIFYPDIFWIWMEWAPGFLRQLFNYKIVEGGGSSVWNPDTSQLSRISSFFMTVRFHFLSLIGTLLALGLLFVKRAWKNEFERRMVFVLTMLFLFLFTIHGWAALGKDYCVFCFAGYVSFFLPIGLVIAIIALSNFVEQQIFCQPLIAVVAILLITPSIFGGSLDTVGRWILNLPAPRFKGGRILAGSTELGTLFENRFKMDYNQLIMTVPPLFGLAVAAFLLVVIWAGHCMINHGKSKNLGHTIIIVFFILGFIFTPTPLLGHSVNENTCGGNFIKAHESAGKQLAETIPPGATVYWGAGSVVTPLIYLTHAQLHPPQLNGIYSYRKGGDRDLLEKSGFYNEESIKHWRENDDFFLISEQYLSESWRKQLRSPDFLEHAATIPINPCRPDSAIHIFERIRR